MAIQLFPAVADNLVLDFINTRFTKNHKIIELLQNTQDLIDWLNIQSKQHAVHMVQLELIASFYQHTADISELILFRNTLYDLLMDCMQDHANVSSIVSYIERVSARNPFVLKAQSGQLRFVPQSINTASLPIILLSELSLLINSQDIFKLSRCYNSECILLFISKTQKRKWCSMEVCGNRKKVAKFIKARKQS